LESKRKVKSYVFVNINLKPFSPSLGGKGVGAGFGRIPRVKSWLWPFSKEKEKKTP